MFAILNEEVALRSWQLIPYAYIVKGSSSPQRLYRDEFEVLIKADGKTQIPESEITKKFIDSGLLIECKEKEFKLSKWQEYRNFNNRLVATMNLQITGRCNYNCKHCFNAKDNHALQSHMTLKQINKLLDEAESCGIMGFTITGGEPMVHKNIKEIIEEIYKRNMFIFDFNTNGYYITQEFLDFLKSLKANPLMKISFDGIGYHDEMRNFKGAEEKALEAFKLCTQNGFKTLAQVNVNYNNLNTIKQTLDLLESMHVSTIRLIRTTEVPRWIKNGGKCLEIKDYYDQMIDLLKDYISKPRFSDIIVWQLLELYPCSQTYKLDAVKDIRMSQPICKGTRGMMAVGANGNVYPCLQVSGVFDDTGEKLGNVFETPLKDLLQTESKYMKYICTTVEEKAKINGRCNKCKYLKYCGTGCPAMSITKTYAEKGVFCYTEPDTWKCYFLENNYYDKVIKSLEGYRCISPKIEL